mmetsp:Transcript_40416/g.47286  ORF Transcript_40416/g.47286 Transcript_40416/m.47286 type:complete len:259 (-) Transcript_40416:89-865(-)
MMRFGMQNRLMASVKSGVHFGDAMNVRTISYKSRMGHFNRQMLTKGKVLSKKKLSSTAGAGKIFSSFQLWYSHQLDVRPIFTKCASAGIVAGFGNLLAQRLMWDTDGKGQFVIDWKQTGRFVVINIIFVAPCLHHWYNWLSAAMPGKSIAPVLKRVFVDEFIFTPVYVPAFMGLLWSFEGNKFEDIPHMIREEWLNIMIFDWCVYIPVQFFNFRYNPVKYQVLVMNLVGVGWSCFISWRAQRQNDKNTSIERGEDEGE